MGHAQTRHTSFTTGYRWHYLTICRCLSQGALGQSALRSPCIVEMAGGEVCLIDAKPSSRLARATSPFAEARNSQSRAVADAGSE